MLLSKISSLPRRFARAVRVEWSAFASEFAEEKAVARRARANKGNPPAIFVWVPKTAGTSVWRALANINAEKFLATGEINQPVSHGINSFGHMSLPLLLENGLIDRHYFTQSFKFCFVRNPFDRAVSLFEFLKKRGSIPQATTFPIFCEFIRCGAYEPVGLYNRTELSQLNTQCSWLKDEDGKYFCDFVGRYESLGKDWEKIWSHLGPDTPKPVLGHHRKSERDSVHQYYTPAEVKIIREAYDEDFAAFGYSTILE